MKTGGPSPELTANVFAYFTWLWLDPLIKLGNQKAVQAEDLYDLLPRETTEYCERRWDESCEKQRRKNPGRPPVVWKLILVSCGREMVWSFLACPIWLAANVAQVFVLKALVVAAEKSRENLPWWRGFSLVLGILVSSIVLSISQHFAFTAGNKSGMKIRSAVSMAVFKKLLQLKTVALAGTSSGQMLNLISNDTQKLVDAAGHAAFTGFAIINSLVVAGISGGEFGVAAIPGVVVILFGLPVQVFIATAVGRIRAKAVKLTDARVRTIQEILSGVRVVKYNGWTAAFLARIQELRSVEIALIKRAAYLRASTSTLKEGMAPLAALVTFGAYVGLYNVSFSASKAFTLLGLYSILVRVYTICPRGVQAASESRIAIQRLQRLLDLPAGKGCSSTEEVEEIQKIYPEAAVAVSEGTFLWYLKDHQKSEASSQVSRLSNEWKTAINPTPYDFLDKQCVLHLAKGALKGIDLTVSKGELIAVVGSVGSGKSSLLQAILGEMECVKGTFFMDKMVSYAPQQPWILNGTVRDNIIFTSKFEKTRYRNTVFACALEHDLRTMPAGDHTEIGERGVNLSGGQKARISLARACYSSSRVVLLDDPLAAVDVPTARHLMQHVLTGILKGRSVILVTHNRSSLELCDRVFLMENGQLQEVELKEEIIQNMASLDLEKESEEIFDHEKECLTRSKNDMQIQGNQSTGRGPGVEKLAVPAGLKESVQMAGKNSDSLPSSVKQESNMKSSGRDMNETLRIAATQMAGSLTMQEDRVIGEVNWKTYLDYAKGSGVWLCALVIFLMFFAQAVRMMVDYWITVWVSSKYHLSTTMYLGLYAVWIGGMLVLCLSRGLCFAEAAIRAAKSMHCLMAISVLRSPVLFFDQNPVGRILNRFSKDQAMVDELLPQTAQEMFEHLVGVLGLMVLMGVIMPWFLLCLPPFLYALWHYQQLYVSVSRELKRLDGLSRSPMYSQFTQTLQGVASVRAYGAEVAMHDHFRNCIDANNRAFILFVQSSRWLGARLDFAATLCLTTTAILAVLLRHSIAPGLIGVVLLQSLQLTGYLQYGVRMTAELQNIFTSVERNQAYSSLPSEADPKSSPGLITDEWPEKGSVEYVEYTMAYRADLPPVLNNLTFKVHPQEKVGILGRTGAGKSSLAAALFRMVENSACGGSIFIDGIDLKLVGLDDLRLRLSIIPQDPVLFRGTVRMNLDPFERHSDIQICEALGKAQLTAKVKSLHLGLDSAVAENGDNFSVGQRQLLCLARALLRRSKIIVMDEATAAVDGETDQLIQKTMRSMFSNCTVMTIAHRIDTVIGCDRVLVLASGGRISEYDSPMNLFRHAEHVSSLTTATDPADHVFANMVFQAGPTVAKQLRDAAEAAENRRLSGKVAGQ